MTEDHPNLAGGLAVVLAVTTLLELLRRAVRHHVDPAVASIWIEGRQLSQNIVGGHLLNDTLTQSRSLVEELEHHVQATEETTS